MINKWLAVLVVFGLIFSGLTGCFDFDEYDDEYYEDDYEDDYEDEDEDDYSDEATKDYGDGTWSIFIYLCGTDLETESMAATQNLEELMYVSTTSDVNFIVQTGGTAQWHTDGIDADMIQRFKIEDGEMFFLEEQALTSMGDPGTLGSFLSWGVEAYPAENLGVIFWNHGGGSIDGIAFDELFDFDALTLKELEVVMDEVSLEMSQNFEFIGFDACLMATLETAAIFAPYANYMVASEETEPGGGWDYEAWGQVLVDNPGMKGDDLGRVICDTYYAKCERYGEEDMATLSVTDLNRLQGLLDSFDGVANELDDTISNVEVLSTVSRGAKKSESYGGDAPGEGYSNLVDLGDLVANIESALPESASNCIAAIEDCVIYQVNGSYRQSATGLAIFFPAELALDDPSLIDRYNEISISNNYNDFLEKVVKGIDTDNVGMEETDETYDVFLQATEYGEEMITEDGYYQMSLYTDLLDMIQTIYFVLSIEYDGYELFLGRDNDLYIDYESGLVEDNFRGVWPTLDGNFASLYIIDEQDEYNIYSIPILLNGERTNIRAGWIWDDPEDDDSDGHYEIYGVWDGIDAETNIPSRNIRQLEDGDEIIPLFQEYDASFDGFSEVEGEAFYVDGEVTLEESPLPADYYKFVYEIIDVYGEAHYSNFVTFEVDEYGDIYISQ